MPKGRKTILSSAVISLCFGVCTALSAQSFADRSPADGERDQTWYRSAESQSDTRAIIHQKAQARAAHRAARLEAQSYAGEYRARPSISTLRIMENMTQPTYPTSYRYGPPMVSNDWGDTQVSVLGENNRSVRGLTIGRGTSPLQAGRPTGTVR
jgi:hypothetical protein